MFLFLFAICRNVEVVAPFPVDAVEHSVHKTYLDSTGRPRITIKKALASESNEQNIYVSLSCSLSLVRSVRRN